ncbi:MAG: hypothetical protein ACREYE_16125 [Gammaproteobacteria bacterium]
MLTPPLRDLFRDLENLDRYATAEVGVREAPGWIELWEAIRRKYASEAAETAAGGDAR